MWTGILAVVLEKPFMVAVAVESMAMDYYIGILDNEGDGDWGIVFPDVPGCVSQGDSYGDALRMGTEALSFHISGLMADGMKVREPRSIDEIRAADEDWYDKEEGIRGVVARVQLLQQQGKALI